LRESRRKPGIQIQIQFKHIHSGLTNPSWRAVNDQRAKLFSGETTRFWPRAEAAVSTTALPQFMCKIAETFYSPNGLFDP